MKITIPAIFTITLLLALCLLSACISPAPAHQTTKQNVSLTIDVGLVPITIPQGPQFFSFDTARKSLVERESYTLNPYSNKTRILFVQGGDLDESGSARRWVFGLNKGGIHELQVYGRFGWTIIPWNATIYSEEIDFDTVISPTYLFNENQAAILEENPSTIPERRDIELINGTYRITITSGSTSRLLLFNATSGKPFSYQ